MLKHGIITINEKAKIMSYYYSYMIMQGEDTCIL